MDLDADTLQARRSAGVEPSLLSSHQAHLQSRQGVAPVVGEALPGQVGGQQGLIKFNISSWIFQLSETGIRLLDLTHLVANVRKVRNLISLFPAGEK